MPFISSARGAYGPQGQKVIKGPLAPVWVTFSPPASTGGYSYQFVATDDSGDAPTYSVASGTIPTGTTLSSSGLLSGTCTVASTFTFSIRATDANGRFTDTGNLSIVVTLRSAATYTLAAVTALGSYVVGDVVNVSYTGSQQTIPKFNATSMRLICRGAAGGGYNYRAGGSGGYSEGVYAISGNIFCHVGGGGGSSVANNDAAGGYNGGGLGPGSDSSGANRNGSGGGATDFRTGSGTWDQNLNTRVIVAGGGGGTNAWNQGGDNQGAGPGGSGGGTNGGNGSGSGQNGNVGGGGTQSSGGNASAGGTGTGQSGGFGFGGAGFRISTSDPSGPGGGGGWYGGGAGAAQNESSAGGGSGYIGGVTSGSTTNGGGTAGVVTDSWSTNNQGNGSAQYVILAIS
jgi:hypothetical protein